MISTKESIPTKNEAFLLGLDVFYTQFNDVSIYVEDLEKENLYFEIFRKLLPGMRIEKIFPLGGKQKVIDQSSENIGDKTKVFVVDKDFDDLLGLQVNRDNLFYLERYSIENFLVTENSLVEYVVEEKPALKRRQIQKELKYNSILNLACRLLFRLTLCHILLQSIGSGIPNVKRSLPRYVNLCVKPTVKLAELKKYESEIDIELKIVNPRYAFRAQLQKLRRRHHLSYPKAVLIHIPGKYLIQFFKAYVEAKFDVSGRNLDSISMRLSKNTDCSNLENLKTSIEAYLT
jgi:hypothetical protein